MNYNLYNSIVEEISKMKDSLDTIETSIRSDEEIQRKPFIKVINLLEAFDKINTAIITAEKKLDEFAEGVA